MNVKQSQYEEIRDSQTLSYLLHDSLSFFPTGYKVLQSQERNGFVNCAKVSHNGKEKLLYDISRYKALDSLLPSLTADKFVILLRNLIEVIITVKNNGFMQCENIEVLFDKIFIDANNYKVYLIYLPVDTPVDPEGYIHFENRLKQNIIQAVKQYKNVDSPVVRELCKKLKDPAYSIESIKASIAAPPQEESLAERLSSEQAFRLYEPPAVKKKRESHQKGLFSRMFKKEPQQKILPSGSRAGYPNLPIRMDSGATELLEGVFVPSITLVGEKTPQKIEFQIIKPEYLIGSKQGGVDGYIGFSRPISRVHCKIVCHQDRYFIVDLNSTNGTYVNGERLAANKEKEIRPGDTIRLARLDFAVRRI